MNISPFLYAIEIIGFLTMGVLALSRRRTKLEISFFAFTISLAFWQFFQLLAILFSDTHSVATYLLMISVASSAFMASMLVVFISIYARKKVPYWIFIFASLFSTLAFFSKALQSTKISEKGIEIPNLDIFYGLIVAFDLFALSFAVAIAVRFYLHTRIRRTKEQLRVMLLGVVATGFVAALSSFNSSEFSNTVYAQHVIPTVCLIAVSSLFYVVVYKGLIDVKRATIRTIAYALSLMSLAAIYFGLAYLLSSLFFKNTPSSGISVSPINMILAIALSFVFQPIKNFFDRVTNRIFFRDMYTTDEFIVSLSETLRSTTDLRLMLQKAAGEIADVLKSERAAFHIPYGVRKHMNAGTHSHWTVPSQDIAACIDYLRDNDFNPVVAELLENHSSMRKLMNSHKIAVIFPLRLMHDTTGFLFLGEHRYKGYSLKDIQLLRTVSDELVIAIQNSLSVQEVKDINANLEQRIEAATAELRTSNARLKRIDASKDEFISMASHQLRTPLTSIKGYLSMVLEGDTGKISQDQRHLLTEAFDSSERMVHLIHDFLNVSRLQNGKFMLEQHPYDLVKLVQGEVNSLSRSAEARQLELSFKSNVESLMLTIDETKIRQVVMNYIDNALYYSRDKGTVKVRLEVVKDEVRVTVVDNGIGVPKAEQEHLFTKFFRAANARKQRPDGTGVGIFLAKKVISEHGGGIIFKSQEGVGSTFGFSLPIKKLASPTE